MRWQRRTPRAFLLAAAAMMMCTGHALGQDVLCLNSNQVPYGTPQTPTVDGTIAGDPGWLTSNQYAFNFVNGTQPDDGTFQMVKANNKLYFAFTVNNDPEYNDKDLIILILGPNPADPTQDRRFHIYPVHAGQGDTNNVAPRLVEAWVNSNLWPTKAQTPDFTNPAWLNVRISSAAASGTGPFTYRVEGSIDLAAAGITLPAAPNHFYMYLNALRLYTQTVGGFTKTKVAGELNWPETDSIPGVPTNPTDSTMMANPVRPWGEVVQNDPHYATCAGVRVKENWINTVGNTWRLSPPDTNGTTTNNYYVRIENAGSQPAGNVLATIYAWRFGIGPLQPYGKVPASPNPLATYTVNPGPIAPGAVVQVGPAAWPIDWATYNSTYGGNPLVCSMVQLDVDPAHTAGVSRTLIGNRYYYMNTWYGTASIFDGVATIDAARFAPPPRGETQQEFDLLAYTHEFTQRAGPVRELKEEDRIENRVLESHLDRFRVRPILMRGGRFAQRTVCGYRHTGRFIRIAGTEAEVMERTQCYAFVISHLGELAQWRSQLAGPGVEQRSPLMYRVAVPMRGVARLSNRVEALPRGRLQPEREQLERERLQKPPLRPVRPAIPPAER